MKFKTANSEEVKKQAVQKPMPEKVRYSRYYEHDGALRVYANRATLASVITGACAIAALGFGIFVRLQPPTVIRVNQNGEAEVLGQTAPSQAITFSVAQGTDTPATEIEKKAFVREFLESYNAFSPDTVNRNWSDALNMMTANLRRSTFDSIEKNNLIGQIQDDQTRSEFEMKSLEISKDDPLSFTVFGVRLVHHLRDNAESVDKLVDEYHVRLVEERRSMRNPSGLLVAEYWEQALEGERRNSVLNAPDNEQAQ